MTSADPKRLRRDVGRRIAELRQEFGLTQEQLAELFEVSSRYVQSIEAGRENLTLDTLAKIARVLATDVVRFLEPPKTKPPRPGRPRKAPPTS